MRQLPSDKYNVAWFKLAEFVSRGERERALGIYKLLVHSLNDRALAYQLEGDLLLSFHDKPAAFQQYYNAVDAYKQDARIVEAAAIYEHLIALDPSLKENLLQILPLYEIIGLKSRLFAHLDRLCCLFVEGNEFEQLEFLMVEWDTKIDHYHAAHLYKNITLELIKKEIAGDIVRFHLKKALDHLLLNKNSPVLQTFLSTIEALHGDYYNEATAHIKEL